jgi:hypothetical protein
MSAFSAAIENPLAVCCCGTVGDRDALSHCPTCDSYICGRSTCDCPCPMVDEPSAFRLWSIIAWQNIRRPLYRVADEVLTAVLRVVLRVIRWSGGTIG